jgi:hypothetical protein
MASILDNLKRVKINKAIAVAASLLLAWLTLDTFFKQSQRQEKTIELPASNFSPFFDDDFTLKNNQSALQSQQLTLEQQQKSLEIVMKRLDEQQKHFDSQRQALNQQIEMLALQTQKQLTLFESTVQTKLKQPKLTPSSSIKQAASSPFGYALPPEVAKNNLQSTKPIQPMQMLVSMAKATQRPLCSEPSIRAFYPMAKNPKSKTV